MQFGTRNQNSHLDSLRESTVAARPTHSRHLVISTMTLLLTALAVLLARPAAAQTYPFYDPTPPFIGGYQADLANDTIDVDQDGDGSTDETFDLPVEIRQQSGTLLQFSLSPSQEVLFTQRSPQTASPVCGGDINNVEVFFHRLVVGSPNSMTLLNGGSTCLRGVLSSGGPRYFDPDRSAAVRTAFVVGAPQIGSQELLFVDLVNGVAAIDALNYTPNINLFGGFTVSPAGNALFVQHDSVTPDWRVVDLCADRSGSAGSGSTQSFGHPVSAELVISGSDLFTRVTRTPTVGTPVVVDLPMNNCFTQPPTLRTLDVTVTGPGAVFSSPAGISCAAGAGTCSADFLDGQDVVLTAISPSPSIFLGWGGACAAAGTTTPTTLGMTQDRSCSASFDGPQMSLTKVGPTTVAAGSDFDYTITYRNDGGVAAHDVVVRDTLPANARFLSASGGGTLQGGTVSWNVGTVGPGQVAQLTATVDSCTAGSLVNSNYSLSGTGVFAFGGPAVTTTVTGGPMPGDVTATLATSPLGPLLPDDVVTHTITLSNNTASAISELTLALGAGAATTFDQFLDDGGGVFTLNGPTSARWNGGLPASGTIQLVFTLRVDSCFQSTTTQLNSGNPIHLFSACGTILTTVPAAPVQQLRQPIEIELDARNLTSDVAPPFDLPVATARPGEAAEVQFTVTNATPTTQSPVQVDLPLPDGWEAAFDPPFLAPSAPGAQWDATTETVSWSGSLAAGQSIRVTVAVRQSTDVGCRALFAATGGVGTCTASAGRTQLLRFAELPTGPYLLSTEVSQGLYVWQPGIDAGFRELLCTSGEVFFSAKEGAAGVLWNAGLPTYSADLEPATLTFQDVTFSPGANPTVTDVAWLSASNEAAFTQRSEVVALDPLTSTLRTVWAPTPAPLIWSMQAAGPSELIAQNGNGLERVDAATGTVLQSYTDPTLPLVFESLALDADGDYLSITLSQDGSGNWIQDLVEVDPTTGLFSVVVADLASATGFAIDPFSGIHFTRVTVDAQGTPYVMLRNVGAGTVFEIDRIAGTGTLLALQGGTPPNPTPGVTPHQFASLDWIDHAPATTDLQLTSMGPAVGSLGLPSTFTVSVTNHSAVDADQVTLRLAPPTSLTLGSLTPTAGSCAGTAPAVCDLGTVAAGATVDIVLEITPSAVGSHFVLGQVNSRQRDGNPPDNVLMIEHGAAVTGGHDLRTTLQAMPEPVSAGTALSYAVALVNDGPDPVTAAELALDLPDAAMLDSIAITGATCTGTDPVVCTATADLNAGAQFGGTVDVDLPPDLGDGSLLLATATVSAPSGTELDPGNDTTQAISTLVNRYDLELSVGESNDPILMSETVLYTFTLDSNGPADAPADAPAGANLEVTLSGGQVVTAIGCSVAGLTTTCPVPSVAREASVVFQLEVQPLAALPIDLQASLTNWTDDDGANDSLSEATRVFAAGFENIDPEDAGEQTVLTEFLGAIDLEPLGDGGPGVEVGNDALSGWMWGTGVGWCSLSCTNDQSCATDDFGVSNDGRGQLAGYAYCDDVQWISWSCTNDSSCGTVDYGVTIDDEGLLHGRAWNSLTGWIDFDTSGVTRPRTSWRAPFFVDGFESGDATSWSGSTPESSTTDVGRRSPGTAGSARQLGVPSKKATRNPRSERDGGAESKAR